MFGCFWLSILRTNNLIWASLVSSTHLVPVSTASVVAFFFGFPGRPRFWTFIYGICGFKVSVRLDRQNGEHNREDQGVRISVAIWFCTAVKANFGLPYFELFRIEDEMRRTQSKEKTLSFAQEL